MDKPKKKILVADDDSAIVDALQFLLEESGYDVIATIDGGAVITLYDEKPDLLLLDIWMSGYDGREICRVLKADKTKSHVPIIAVSANRDIQKISEEMGADDFIAKPFEMDELLQKIDAHL